MSPERGDSEITAIPLLLPPLAGLVGRGVFRFTHTPAPPPACYMLPVAPLVQERVAPSPDTQLSGAALEQGFELLDACVEESQQLLVQFRVGRSDKRLLVAR